MKRSLYNAWLKALETAPNGAGVLKNDQGMCCLGVLCSIIPEVTESIYKEAEGSVTQFAYKGTNSIHYLPDNLAGELSMSTSGSAYFGTGVSLTILNDSSNTFAPVIQALRDHPENYFEIEED